MNTKSLLSVVLLLVNIHFAFSQDFNLIHYAKKATGHTECEKHPFIAILRNASFSQIQLAQFLTDRLYILNYLEKAILQTEDSILFYRSHVYASELVKLYQVNPEQLVKIPSVSQAAQDYVIYLKLIEYEEKIIHLWLILFGETFGAQHMAEYFQKKFPMIGHSLKDYPAHYKLPKIRQIYMTWINEKLALTNYTQNQIHEQIDRGYEFQIRAFDAAKESVSSSSFFYSWYSYFFN